MPARVANEDALIKRWIEVNPNKPGPADAWVLPGCVAVWVLIRQLDLEGGAVETVANDYELPLEAVGAAIAYHKKHRKVIDQRIARNRAFFAALHE